MIKPEIVGPPKPARRDEASQSPPMTDKGKASQSIKDKISPDTISCIPTFDRIKNKGKNSTLFFSIQMALHEILNITRYVRRTCAEPASRSVAGYTTLNTKITQTINNNRKWPLLHTCNKNSVDKSRKSCR